MYKTINLTLSNDILDRQEDVYAFVEFGKFTSRFSISDQIISSKFWDFLNSEYKVKPQNILTQCEIIKDVKNREERNYKYVVTINKPYKIMLVFYDEKKVIDNKLYTKEEQENKIFELIIYFDSDALGYVEKEFIPKIDDMIYHQPKNKSFFIISRGNYGYELRNAKIKDFDINIKMNYGDEFIVKDKEIVKKLRENSRGLFLFHGASGTGKTTYLRKIIHDLSEEKTIIYVPSYMMHSIADPELISFVSKFPNSILLLEDAESILTSSTEDRDQAVTNILNISDGLLNDYMDMQIIATLNVERKVIDDALLRKGRLKVNYKFKLLSAKQATKLSRYIKTYKKYDKPQTLAEVYDEQNGNQLIDLIDNNENNKSFGY